MPSLRASSVWSMAQYIPLLSRWQMTSCHRTYVWSVWHSCGSFIVSYTRVFENLSTDKIDQPALALELVRTIALMFSGSNHSLSQTAFFPFAAGLISSIKGIHTLTFVTVPLASATACLWFLLPSKIPHRKTTIV